MGVLMHFWSKIGRGTGPWPSATPTGQCIHNAWLNFPRKRSCTRKTYMLNLINSRSTDHNVRYLLAHNTTFTDIANSSLRLQWGNLSKIKKEFLSVTLLSLAIFLLNII